MKVVTVLAMPVVLSVIVLVLAASIRAERIVTENEGVPARYLTPSR